MSRYILARIYLFTHNVPHHLTQANLQTSLDMELEVAYLITEPKSRRAWGQCVCDCYTFTL